MTQRKFTGTGVALVTPFNSNAEIDYEGLRRLINHCIDGGVEYVVSLGTTGESVNLSKEEKKEVLDFTVSVVNGRVPIVAGFGGNSTHQILREIEQYHFNGIDAILSVSPYYNKPTQEGIIAHYKTLAAVAPRPVILYNVPGRTGSNIKAETTLRLANETDNIIGIKEASGDFTQCMQIFKNKPKDFLLISGDDNFTLGLMAYGFDGVISVVGQAFPNIFSEMVRCCLRGDYTTARTLHYQLNDITDMLFAEGNPGGIKYALEVLGICEGYLRLPLYPVSEHLRAKMRKAIHALHATADAHS